MGHLPGGDSSLALAVSGDGSAVVGQAWIGGSWSAVRWTRTTGLSAIARPLSKARAVSHDGSVVVGYQHRSGAVSTREPFRWEAPGPAIGFGHLVGSGSSEANGVSADGSVVVGRAYFQTLQLGFRWSAGSLLPLADLPLGPYESAATGVSADGSIIVGAGTRPGYAEAMYWSAPHNSPFGLGVLSPRAPLSAAYAASADGSTIVGTSRVFGLGEQPFRWQAGVKRTLGYLPPRSGHAGAAFSVSADGSVVVGRSDDSGLDVAFLWTEERGIERVSELLAAHGVDTSGWILRSARGVSADGQVVVGDGVNPNGRAEGWIAFLPRPCADGEDNDGDGFTDFAGGDPGCFNAGYFTESPQCQDGIDNDGDGKMDYDAGLSANGYADPAGPNPYCVGSPWRIFETPPTCGLGAELALLIPLMLAWRSRKLAGRTAA
ncbi:MAG: PEP-CTERM sorting domain-containing protein [bacterium]|nr:PEP-CTERM sorting domain-containing protein [bacterium]